MALDSTPIIVAEDPMMIEGTRYLLSIKNMEYI